jgi:hypothetical protein
VSGLSRAGFWGERSSSVKLPVTGAPIRIIEPAGSGIAPRAKIIAVGALKTQKPRSSILVDPKHHCPPCNKDSIFTSATMPPSKAKKQTISQSLEILGIQDASVFESCTNGRGDEFKVVRKIYLQVVLTAHPDKGGDPGVFREIQTSFEMLRDLHAGKRSGEWLFSECLEEGGAAKKSSGKAQEDTYNMGDYDAAFDTMDTPSWDYYAEAAEEQVPIYWVELAKSGRSKCVQKGNTSKKCSELPPDVDPAKCEDLAKRQEPEFIEKGEIRVGSWMEETGTYARWNHLRCWRK